jgi:hypothetical protein
VAIIVGMRPAIDRSAVSEHDALIVRTDFSDDAAWRAIATELAAPYGQSPRCEPSPQLIDDPAFDGATADEVLALVADDDYLPLIFVADAATMREPHLLLAATTLTRDDCADQDDFDYTFSYGRELRLAPALADEVHGGLLLGNVDWPQVCATTSGRRRAA